MNDTLLNFLKDSECFDDFINQADKELADQIGKDTGRNPYNILHEEIVEQGREIWDEYINNSI